MTSDKSYAVEQRLNGLITQLNGGTFPNTDGNTYQLGTLHVQLGSNIPINSTTPTSLLTWSAANGASYRIWGAITGTMGGTAATTQWQINGPAAATSVKVTYFLYGGPVDGSAQTPFVEQLNALGGLLTNALPFGNTIAASRAFVVLVAGTITGVGAAGTMQFTAAEGISGDSWTANSGSFLDIARIS